LGGDPNRYRMSTNAGSEVVIVGGGVIGLAVARELALRGVRPVTVLERGDFGLEASWAAGGMLAPQSEAETDDDFFRLAWASREMYPDLADALREETGIDIGLDQTGTLYLAFTNDDLRRLESRYRWQLAAGLPVEALTNAEARQLEPGLSPRIRGALRFPLDIQVENRHLVQALLKSCENLGVRLAPWSEAVSLNLVGARITSVSTATTQLNTEQVIVAGGSWSSLIPFSDGRTAPVAIKPVRGQMLCFRNDKPVSRHVIYSARGYLVPRSDGRLLAGSTSEWTGFTKEVTAAGLQNIGAQSIEMMPGISSLPLIDHWSGLRPRASDGLPVVGQVEQLAGLFYATGHYRNGILLAPITAQSVSQMITTGSISKLIGPFGPNRFHRVLDAQHRASA
jgi:glycine oxidase